MPLNTIAVHSRDKEGYGANHEVNSPKISRNFPKGYFWLGKTKT